MRILIVEDHEDTAQAMQRLLAREGHDITIARTRRDALRHCEMDEPFGLLICDIGLPDGNGWDLMREQTRCRDIPAIAVSGFNDPQDSRKSTDAGFFVHLPKPIDYAKLQSIIRELSDPRDIDISESPDPTPG